MKKNKRILALASVIGCGFLLSGFPTTKNTSAERFENKTANLVGINVLEGKSGLYTDKFNAINTDLNRLSVQNVRHLKRNINVGELPEGVTMDDVKREMQIVGDTATVIYGTETGDSYLEYALNGQDTVVLYVYEKVLEGNVRFNGKMPTLSVTGKSEKIEADSTETEIGQYSDPEVYTRIKLTYNLGEVADGATLRVDLYDQGEDDSVVQLGRLEMYNSEKTVEKRVVAAQSKFENMGWITPSEIGFDKLISDSVEFDRAFATQAEAGFNVSMPGNMQGGINDEQSLYFSHRTIKTCEKLGMEAFIYDGALVAYLQSEGYNEETAREMTARYSRSDAFKGLHVTDEPSVSEMKGLKVAGERFKTIFPDKIFNVNLYPEYVYGGESLVKNYDDYMQTYFDYLPADRVSHDYYVLEGLTEDAYKMKTGHLRNLETIANLAEQYDTEFHTILASTTHFNKLRGCHTKADATFQAYSAMAYGVKGFTWFTYYAFNTDTGMLTAGGDKTDTFDAVQQAHEEIYSFADKYLEYHWTGTMPISRATGETNPNFANLRTPLQEHEAIYSTFATQDTVMGTFKNSEGQNAFLLCNYTDPGYNKKDMVTLSFDKAYDLVIYQNGQTVTVSDVEDYTFTLEAGGGVFVELSEKKVAPPSGSDSSSEEESSSEAGNTGDSADSVSSEASNSASEAQGNEASRGCAASLNGGTAAISGVLTAFAIGCVWAKKKYRNK